MSNLNDLLQTTDATKWAKGFVNLIENKPNGFVDEGLMMAWFANAIMTGYDSGRRAEESLWIGKGLEKQPANDGSTVS